MTFCRDKNDNLIESFEDAERIAKERSEETGNPWIAIDRGGSVWPRYGIAEPPKVGEKVSKAFNGDYYPCGVITSVSKSFHTVKTSTGEVFRRKKKTGSWKEQKGSPFNMVNGHHDKRNPHF